jgi:electron transport complex protein RnfG
MAEPAPRPWVSAVIAAAVLGIFAVIGASLVGLSYEGTAERIAQNEKQALLDQLNAILPSAEYDNQLLHDYFDLQARPELGAEQTRAYRARKAGAPVAVILSPVVAKGYNGGITLVVGIRADGSLAGVRALSQKETPGLGDKIDIQKSNWILGFNGKSLDNPSEDKWKVRRDGGDFDQFTGATITPRGVVAAVHKALVYYQANKDKLFNTESIYREPEHG